MHAGIPRKGRGGGGLGRYASVPLNIVNDTSEGLSTIQGWTSRYLDVGEVGGLLVLQFLGQVVLLQGHIMGPLQALVSGVNDLDRQPLHCLIHVLCSTKRPLSRCFHAAL